MSSKLLMAPVRGFFCFLDALRRSPMVMMVLPKVAQDVAGSLGGFVAKAAAAVMILLAASSAQAGNGLAGATILIIRHAEKPIMGRGLSEEGRRHAEAYVKYFSNFVVDGAPLKLDALIAAADSKNSQRPKATLGPLARSLGLPINTLFKDQESEALAAVLKAEPHGKQLLICWHHKEIPDLLRDLGADPKDLLPKGKWPEDQFRWVIELRYDGEGNLIPAQCRRIEEDI